MFKKWQFLVIQLFLLVLMSVHHSSCKKIPLPCDYHESKNITDGTNHKNGSYSLNGHMFHNGSYGYTDKIFLLDKTNKTVEEHLRGCLCGFEASKPCVSSCCPENYIKKTDSSPCEPFNHTLIVNSTNNDRNKLINVTEHYTPTLRICDGFKLPENYFEWKLLEVSKLYLKFFI